MTKQDFEYPFHLPNDWLECITYIEDWEDHYGWWEENLPQELHHVPSNFDFLKTALDILGASFFEFGPPRNEEFILESIKQFPAITQNALFRAIPLSWWRERDNFVSKLIENNYRSYSNAPKKLRWDKSFALNAATINGAILEFSPMVIRKDLEIANAALDSNPFAVHFLTNATKTAMDDLLIDKCLEISKGSKEAIFKIKNKKLITNLFVSLMNRPKSVENSGLINNIGGYFQKRSTYPLEMDFDIFLHALNVNPDLISYIKMSHLEELGNLLNQSLTKNVFINLEQIQQVQALLFKTYIDRTKNLSFLNPLESAGYAKRIAGL